MGFPDFFENKISPDTYFAGGLCNNCRIESDVTDLPEPDSPTMATISLLFISKETFLTAEVLPYSVLKSTERFFICRRGNNRVIVKSYLGKSITTARHLPHQNFKCLTVNPLFINCFRESTPIFKCLSTN